MIIFRSFTLYLALAGLITATLLIKKMSASDPKSQHFAVAVNPYETTLAASGIIEAMDKNIEIGVPQSGLIKEVYIKVGDLVHPGDVLFCLDDRELTAQLGVQKAKIAVAKAHLKRLKDQLDRLESVQDARAVSLEEMTTRRHDVAVSTAELEAAEAELNQTHLLMERHHICAPCQGMILQNNIRKGEFISTSSSPAMILGNTEYLQVRVDLDEHNAPYINSQMKATAFPKNNPDLKIPLHFDHIEPYMIAKRSLTGASDERVDTRVLQVIYLFDKLPNFPLYVGQQMDIFIERSPLSPSIDPVTADGQGILNDAS